MEKEIFENEDYKEISNFIEKKLPILKQNEKFKEKYIRLSDVMEELEKTLSDEQKQKFDEIVELFYKTEEYYFAFSYSLGVNVGVEVNKLYIWRALDFLKIYIC